MSSKADCSYATVNLRALCVDRVVGLEAYATGIDRGFSPELNVPGDARFGRTEESA